MPESTRSRKWLKGWTGSDADGASRLPRHPLLLRPRRRPCLLDEEDRERSKPTGIASRLLHDNHSRTLIDNGSRRGTRDDHPKNQQRYTRRRELHTTIGKDRVNGRRNDPEKQRSALG